MKTQISNLVKGDHREGIVGTSSEIRSAISKKVREENPENLTIGFRGFKFTLLGSWSVSCKSVSYKCEIPLFLYFEFVGSFGVPETDAEAYITIDTNCHVTLTTNSKNNGFHHIPASEITIL